MAEYIEREAFLTDKKWLYCTDCDKRKGKKRGKMVTLYEIGEAPCKSCGIHDMLEEVEDYPAADVRPVVRGKWVNDHNGKYSASGDNFYCSICKDPSLRAFGKPARTNFCPNCGADMRIFSTNCKNTVTTGEDREISNLRAWLKNGQEDKTK